MSPPLFATSRKKPRGSILCQSRQPLIIGLWREKAGREPTSQTPALSSRAGRPGPGRDAGLLPEPQAPPPPPEGHSGQALPPAASLPPPALPLGHPFPGGCLGLGWGYEGSREQKEEEECTPSFIPEKERQAGGEGEGSGHTTPGGHPRMGLLPW